MKTYKKFLLSAFVLFMAYSASSPQTTSAFWPFDYFKQGSVQNSENLAGAVMKTSGEQITLCQLTDLFISFGIIPRNKIVQARQAVSGYCSTPGSSSSVSSAHAEWSLVSADAIGTAGITGIASSSVTGTITLKVKAVGGRMIKPVAGDFTAVFASSTMKNGDYNAGNSIKIMPTAQVSPSDSLIGEGREYTVVITGVIYSSNLLLGSSQPLFMAIKDIDSNVGGIKTVNQTWGIDNFYANPVRLTKGGF